MYQISSRLYFWYRSSTKIHWSKWFYLLLIYKSHLYFLQSFLSSGPSVQENKHKLIFKMAAILDFQSEQFSFFWSTLPQYCLSLESAGLLVQEKSKIDLQDGRNGNSWDFWSQRIELFFYLQVAPILPSFKSNDLLIQKHNIDFQDSGHDGHVWFPIRTILATFDLQVAPILPTKFRLNRPFSSGEAQNIFSRWSPWRPSWICNWNDFSNFRSASCPNKYFLPS